MSINKYTTAEGLVTLANGSRMWVGTKAAYEAAKQAGTMPNDVLIAITDDSQDNNYSTEEVLTGKFWIDGKPIYRKVIDIGAFPNAGTKTISTQISDVDIFTKIDGTAYNSIMNRSIPIPYSNEQNVNHQVRVIIENHSDCQLSICTNDNYSNFYGYMILEYTKTTD